MYAARAVPDVISGGWGVGGGKGGDTGKKGGACNATKAHDTLPKQVSLRFNSTMFRQRADSYRALSRNAYKCRQTIGIYSMTNTTTKQATIKPFTSTMRAKGLAAYTSGVKADTDKEAFFKAIESRVALDQVAQYRAEFKSIAIMHYAQSTGLGDALIEELANPTLKETVKMKGCNLTIRTIKNGISIMTGRWIKAYKSYLNTKVVDGRKAPKKRATKGAVKPKKPVDTVELNQAPEMTPLKRAIEQVSSIPNMVLKETLPSQCEEDLRAEIQIAALQLVELLCKIK